MNFLQGYSDGEVKFKIIKWDGQPIVPSKWREICKGIDIIYFNYTTNADMFVTMGMTAEMNGVKMVMDLDDALWHINKDNTAYDSYKPGSLGIATFNDITNYVPYLTCTSSYLKNVIVNNTRKKHNQIEVFPNTVDTQIYDKIPPFKDTNEINIVHYGSSSHYTDLSDPIFVEAIDRIMQEYPNVNLLTVGSFFGDFKMRWGRRYNEEFGAINFMEWATKRFPEVMAKTDIFVAPLTLGNIYNKCKSDIKRSEVATAKKPFVATNIRQYQEVIENGVDGMLAGTTLEWYQAIKKLCDDKELRKSIGENGYNRVMKERQSKDQVIRYCNFFKKVLE
jgi:glycosyltransferase involved in cell wall biosynthesis